MSERRRLANRRASEKLSFRCANLDYTATISRHADGTVGEIFLSNHKAGSSADVGARDAAIAASFALQHGCDLDTLRKALCRNSAGQANGPLGVALDLICAGAKR